MSLEFFCLFFCYWHKICVYISDLDTQESMNDSCSGLLQFADPPPSPPPDPKPPPSRHSSHSPPRQRARYLPQAPEEQHVRGRGYRRGLGRGQMFEDPAVIRIVQGRPTLKVGCDSSSFYFSFITAAAHTSLCLLLKGSWQCHRGLWERHVFQFSWGQSESAPWIVWPPYPKLTQNHSAEMLAFMLVVHGTILQKEKNYRIHTAGKDHFK